VQNIISNADIRSNSNKPLAFQNDEETLVIDSRSVLTPSQLVEQKLIGRLKESPLLMSQMQRRLKPGPR
jgi:hypothetical protein